MVSRSQQDQYAARLRQVIAEHGWAVQTVHGDQDHPSFSYTVGLTEAGLPELVILGLSANVAGTILNMLAKRSLESDLEVGRRYELSNGDETLEYLIRPVSSPSCRSYLKTAALLYGRHRVKALQVIWPSKDGLFPTDEGWDLARIQPTLG